MAVRYEEWPIGWVKLSEILAFCHHLDYLALLNHNALQWLCCVIRISGRMVTLGVVVDFVDFVDFFHAKNLMQR